MAIEPTQPTGAEQDGGGRYRVGSVARALKILDLVAGTQSDGLRLSELARSLEISKSATYALVRTLTDADFLRAVEPGPRYVLGMALIRLGDDAAETVPLGRVCEPVLAELVRETGLTCRAAIVVDGGPEFIARVHAHGAIRFNTPLGIRESPHATAAGKAILSMLPDEVVSRVLADGLPARTSRTITDPDDLARDLEMTRRRGYALDDEEDTEGLFCFGAPFFDHTGRVAGALSATGIKRDLPAHRIVALGQTVRVSADRLTTLIDGVVPTTVPGD